MLFKMAMVQSKSFTVCTHQTRSNLMVVLLRAHTVFWSSTSALVCVVESKGMGKLLLLLSHKLRVACTQTQRANYGVIELSVILFKMAMVQSKSFTRCQALWL